MVAIAHPGSCDPRRPRSHLSLVPPLPQRARRPSAGVLWRRRALASLALVAVALVAGGWGSRLLGAGGATGTGPVHGSVGAPEVRVRPLGVVATVHVVQPGDTLWSIARTVQPSGDVRPLVDALAAEQGGRPLQVGQRLALPAP